MLMTERNWSIFGQLHTSIKRTEVIVQHQSVNNAMDTFRPSNSSLNCSNNESRAGDTRVSDSTSTLLNRKYLGITKGSSGRWTAWISFEGSQRYLGTFNTAEEAADAFARARIERDSMKKRQKFDHEEPHKSLTKCTEMKSKFCFESASVDGIRRSSSSLNYPYNEARIDTPVPESTGTLLNIKYQGIRQTNAGRWTARILFEGSQRYLGTFNTAEEAADAYARAKMECDSMKKRQKFDHKEPHNSMTKCKELKSKLCFESASVDEAIDGIRRSGSSLNYPNNEARIDTPVPESTGTRLNIKYRGIRQTNAGRWTAALKFRGSQRYLGTFNTAEEAADAYARAKMECDSMKKRQKFDHKEPHKSMTKCKELKSKLCFESASVDEAMDGIRRSGSSLNYPNNEARIDTPVPERTGTRLNIKYRGVRQRKSGRWEAGFSFRGYRRHLGTFDTAGEAADAYARAKIEHGLKMIKQEVNFEEACKSDPNSGKAMNSKPLFDSAYGVSFGTDENHREAKKACSKRELEGQQDYDFGKKSLDIVSPDLKHNGENYGVTVAADSQQSKDSYTSHRSVTGNQLLHNLCLEIEEDLSTEIVNSYGQLVGEYSRLDDQLWFCRGEEEDADDTV